LSNPVEPNEPPQDLTPAWGRQDHTISPYAHSLLPKSPGGLVAPKSFSEGGEKNSAVISRAWYRSRRAIRPATHRNAKRCRVHRISSRVRDDRDPPLWWDKTAQLIEAISEKRKLNIFRYGAGQGKSHQI
jgi:hypothetical protein